MRLLWTVAMAGFLVVNTLAHRLDVDWTVTDNRLAVSANLDGVPSAGADVAVTSLQGGVLVTGTLDGGGVFSTELPSADDFTVTVNAGLGHRRTIRISAAQLQAARTPAAAVPSDREPGAPAIRPRSVSAAGSSDQGFALPVRVGTGLALVLALGAAWMSIRNSRRLSALERQVADHARRS